MIDPEPLSSLCDPTARKSAAHRPWRLVLGGQPYVWATNAHALAVVAMESTLPEAEPSYVKLVLRLLEAAGQARSGSRPVLGRASLEALKDWCGPYEPRVVCPTCDGEGEIATQRRVKLCPTCKGDCGSGGAIRAGVVCGVDVDRNLLARYLAPFSGGDVTLFDAGKASADQMTLSTLGVLGDGWSAFVVPVEAVRPEGAEPLPAFQTEPQLAEEIA